MRSRAHGVAVVIPVLADQRALSALLSALRAQAPAEVIVVSGREDPDMAAWCREHGCVYLERSANRGAQLDAGANAAEAPVLWFLHADVELSPHALGEIDAAIAAGSESGCFRFAFQGPSTWYKRLLEALVALRIRCGGVPYGDQGIFVSRDAYFASGGFAREPLFEEVRLVKRLRARGTFCVLSDPIRVSTRRWERDGWWYRTLHNRWLALRFALGTPPQALAASYRRLVRSGEEHER